MVIDYGAIPVPVKCQGCGHTTRHTIGRLQGNPRVTCPTCERVTVVNLQDDQARATVDGVNREIEAFRGRARKALNRTIKINL